MSTNKTNLQKARDNLIANLEEITRSPKPTYSIDGETWSWTEYQQYLIKAIAEMKLLIEGEDDDDIVEELSEMI